jgi:hypothetical protein
MSKLANPNSLTLTEVETQLCIQREVTNVLLGFVLKGQEFNDCVILDVIENHEI